MRGGVKRASSNAHVAQKEWAKFQPIPCCIAKWLVHQLILENKEDLARLMTIEQGASLAEATGEVVYGVY
ncbi:aldehyde dehydrogenase family protein [Vibrio lentus]|nr:aldehyde dehydrogenase family protein [Vibrio lentus]